MTACVVLFDVDDPLRNGNFDAGVLQGRVYCDRHIALHEWKPRHVVSRETEYEHERVFAELLQHGVGRRSFDNIWMRRGSFDQ